MALRLDHAEELVELATKLGLILMVAFNRRYEPPFVKARELVKAGSLGDLRLIDAHMAYDWDLWFNSSETRFLAQPRRCWTVYPRHKPPYFPKQPLEAIRLQTVAVSSPTGGRTPLTHVSGSPAESVFAHMRLFRVRLVYNVTYAA